MVAFKDRIEKSITISGKTWEDLRRHLGVTSQAITKLKDSKSKAMNAENCAKAARFFEVDFFWLATGEGRPRPESVWPFEFILPSQYKQLDADIKRRIESELAGEWLRFQSKSGTNS